MSRVPQPIGGETDKNDPFLSWVPNQRELKFVLTFNTEDLVVKETVKTDGVKTDGVKTDGVKTDGVKTDGASHFVYRGGESLQSCILSFYANKFDLGKCIVERVSCKIVASPGSVATTMGCPTVDVYFGSDQDRLRLEPAVRNAPCGGCPLYGGTELTKVHEWEMNTNQFERCKKFGNFTPANLANTGIAIGRGGAVTLPPCFANLAEEHLNTGNQTERRTTTDNNQYDRTFFEKELKPLFLEAVSDVRSCFCDANKVDVVLRMNPTCVLTNDVNLDETVSVVVVALVWCEGKTM
jgi:hypothetical protein